MADRFAEWCVLEVMGHRRLAGFLTEQEIGGQGFLRIDVPNAESGELEGGTTQFYAPSSVFAIHPVTEETARQVAAGGAPAPVQRWELPAPAAVVPDMNDDRDPADPFDGEGPF